MVREKEINFFKQLVDRVDMKLFTIGFTGKSAEKFFGLLETSKASKLIGIRI